MIKHFLFLITFIYEIKFNIPVEDKNQILFLINIVSMMILYILENNNE